MDVKIKEIFEEKGMPATNKGERSKVPENSKSYLLGLTLMNYMGKKVLASAVNTLESEIKKQPALYFTDITEEVDDGEGEEVAVDYLVLAIGAEDKPIQVDCDPPSGTRFPVGQTTEVSCKAIDEKTGLETKGSFRVTVTRKGVPLTRRLGLSEDQDLEKM